MPTKTAFAGGKGAYRSCDKPFTQKQRDEGVVAHEGNGLAKNARQCMKDPYRRAEATYQLPIPLAIFFKSFLSFFK